MPGQVPPLHQLHWICERGRAQSNCKGCGISDSTLRGQEQTFKGKGACGNTSIKEKGGEDRVKILQLPSWLLNPPLVSFHVSAPLFSPLWNRLHSLLPGFLWGLSKVVYRHHDNSFLCLCSRCVPGTLPSALLGSCSLTQLQRSVPLLSPFNRWGDWSTESESLPKDSQLAKARPRSWRQADWLQSSDSWQTKLMGAPAWAWSPLDRAGRGSEGTRAHSRNVLDPEHCRVLMFRLWGSAARPSCCGPLTIAGPHHN